MNKGVLMNYIKMPITEAGVISRANGYQTLSVFAQDLAQVIGQVDITRHDGTLMHSFTAKRQRIL